MRQRGSWVGRAVMGLGLIGVLGGAGWTQQPDPNFPSAHNPAPGNPGHRPELGERNGFPEMQEKQAKLRNDERQRRLVSDTDKLLALATQLHADVAKTDKNVLSLDVIRRAEEIEKLAHGVKERMKS